MKEAEKDKAKIWVGGLPPRTQKDTLKSEFIREFNLTDKNIISQISIMIKLGYGFITIPIELMTEIEDQLKDSNIHISTKKLELIPAMKRKDARKKIEEERSRKLYVGGLPLDTTKEELREYFEKYGELDFANIVYSVGSTLPRGFAFVKLKEIEAVDSVLEQKFHKLRGYPLYIKRSVPKQEICLKNQEVTKKKKNTSSDHQSENAYSFMSFQKNNFKTLSNNAFSCESPQGLMPGAFSCSNNQSNFSQNEYSKKKILNQNSVNFNPHLNSYSYNNDQQNQLYAQNMFAFENKQVSNYDYNQIYNNNDSLRKEANELYNYDRPYPETNSLYNNISSPDNYYMNCNEDKTHMSLQNNKPESVDVRNNYQHYNEINSKDYNFDVSNQQKVIPHTIEVPYQVYNNNSYAEQNNPETNYEQNYYQKIDESSFNNKDTDQFKFTNYQPNDRSDANKNFYNDYNQNNQYYNQDQKQNPYLNNQYEINKVSPYNNNQDHQQYQINDYSNQYDENKLSFKNETDYYQQPKINVASYNNSFYDGSNNEENHFISNSRKNEHLSHSDNRNYSEPCNYNEQAFQYRDETENCNKNPFYKNNNTYQFAQNTPYHCQSSLYNNSDYHNYDNTPYYNNMGNFQKPLDKSGKNIFGNHSDAPSLDEGKILFLNK